MEQQIKIGIGILIIVILSSLASGFGVSSSYWKENPLLMYPGETKDVALLLQNLVGDKDMIINVELVEGKEIATLLDKSNEYKIPLGKKDVPINIRIKIPENTDLDENIGVGVLISTIPADFDNRTITLTGRIIQSIPIRVLNNKSKSLDKWVVDENNNQNSSIDKSVKANDNWLKNLFLFIKSLVLNYIN